MMEQNKIYNIDCGEGLKQIQNDTISFVLTSPPYDNLRNYGNITEWNFEKFKVIAQEIKRILKDGGVCVWVVGDATINGSETGSSFMQALYFKEIGLNLWDTMIYKKANPIPQNHSRYEQAFEYMFVISKGKPAIFNAIKEQCKNVGKCYQWGRDNNTTERTIKHLRADDKRPTLSNKMHTNIFTYGIGGGTFNHPAVFPLKLAVDMISTFTNVGDLVVDPFMGSGTTAIAAIKLNRHFIGFEINSTYVACAENRIKKELCQTKLFF